jgi:hypothetical protein
MILQIYTIIHTLISLVAIFTGFVVVFGMHTMAPMQTEPPFKLTQLIALLVSALLAIVAAIRFHPERIRTA